MQPVLSGIVAAMPIWPIHVSWPPPPARYLAQFFRVSVFRHTKHQGTTRTIATSHTKFTTKKIITNFIFYFTL